MFFTKNTHQDAEKDATVRANVKTLNLKLRQNNCIGSPRNRYDLKKTRSFSARSFQVAAADQCIDERMKKMQNLKGTENISKVKLSQVSSKKNSAFYKLL